MIKLSFNELQSFPAMNRLCYLCRIWCKGRAAPTATHGSGTCLEWANNPPFEQKTAFLYQCKIGAQKVPFQWKISDLGRKELVVHFLDIALWLNVLCQCYSCTSDTFCLCFFIYRSSSSSGIELGSSQQ